MSLSNLYETKVLKHLLGIETFTVPSTMHLALFSSNAGLETNDIGASTEISGGGYARLPVIASQLSVNATPVGTNTVKFEFDPTTANWATITHAALVDAATGGNVIIWFQLTAAITPLSGNIVRIPIGNLSITID